MAITPKNEAIMMAKINLESDSERYVRQIEAQLMVWDTKSEIKIAIPANDVAIGQHLVREYREAGWFPRLVKKAGSSRDYWFTLPA
jgi:hypothetical protein